jgi:ribosomal protein S18 acetylase RimI-like enzyme
MADLGSGPLIRAASIDDAGAIVEFNRLLALESEGIQLDPAALDQGVRLALGRPDLCRYFLAEVEGQLAGQTMLTYELTDWRNGIIWWIQSVYVAPAFRRRGVFGALYRHIESLAQSSPEVRGLRLYVHQHNASAQAVYRRLGLESSGHFVLEKGMNDEGKE